MTHICIGNLTIVDSDNGLSPGRRQAIIWTNVGIFLIGPLGTNCNEISIEIHTFSFKEIHWKLSSGNWRPFCLDPNVLYISHSEVHNEHCHRAHKYLTRAVKASAWQMNISPTYTDKWYSHDSLHGKQFYSHIQHWKCASEECFWNKWLPGMWCNHGL